MLMSTTTVKRALRAIESPAYDKAAAKKGSKLPQKSETMTTSEIFKLLPLSLLALRVTKIDPHEGHGHAAPKKRVKGLWTVRIEQQQDVRAELHYAWLYDGPQTKQKVYAALALFTVLTLVCFPLWPITLRLGVWYISMAMLTVLGLFFAMAFVRLVLFCLTVFTIPPGFWLYPNLFEDVGFFDSFRPVWGWQEVRSWRLLLVVAHFLTSVWCRTPRPSEKPSAMHAKQKQQPVQPKLGSAIPQLPLRPRPRRAPRNPKLRQLRRQCQARAN